MAIGRRVKQWRVTEQHLPPTVLWMKHHGDITILFFLSGVGSS